MRHVLDNSSCLVHFYSPGEVYPYAPFYRAAWEECEELQCQDVDEFERKAFEEMKSIPHVVILYRLADGEMVGAMTLAEDDDMHVGKCMGVMWSYVYPEYRGGAVGATLYRKALEITKDFQLPVLKYTHRVGPWKYLHQYRRINNGQ